MIYFSKGGNWEELRHSLVRQFSSPTFFRLLIRRTNELIQKSKIFINPTVQ